MPNTSMPAGEVGGHPTASTRAGELELPARLRVHALAKLLGVSSQEVLAALTELGAPARGVQSSVDRETALRVIEALLPDADEPLRPADEAAPEPSDEAALEPSDEAAPGPAADQPGEERPAAGLLPAEPLSPLFAPPVFLPPQPAAAVTDAAVEEVHEPGEGRDSEDESGAPRRRRRRGRRGRGRGKAGPSDDQGEDEGGEGAEGPEPAAVQDRDTAEDRQPAQTAEAGAGEAEAGDEDEADEGTVSTRRRRRRRRRASGDGENQRPEDPNTVVHVREIPRGEGVDADEVQGVRGSTRLEAKRQRRRDGREAGRRRVPMLSEAEFLARRESVERTMVVRQLGERTQIGVLEDGVLVEHYISSAGSASMVGNVYLGRVQNVLPSMEAAFVDIGRGRNAVLYAGEVDWDAAGLEGKQRRIEQALSPGDSVLVQVTKDPVGHKGARLTTQISLPGRFLVYVPSGGATGISRKLPDVERKRLKDLLKRIVPEDAGVIIRTASEGVSEAELERDVRRLRAQWEVIKTKAEAPATKAPQLLYEEPDLLIKVVRDLFNEDFSTLVVSGDDAWDIVEAYVAHVAPELTPRLRRHTGTVDVFTEFRIDEQIAKALDRKVWLPSGGTLVIDRTEAMTVIDVNTGKFTGSGGNLEETVTRNNLEAAEEIVRQLRLRDIGGIIVIDFIDMVLESNRDLVVRRLTECLGRDRTRHQVAEVTSLGLVQMTRKRVGTSLLDAYSTVCEHCHGRGVILSGWPAEQRGDGAPPAAPPEPTVRAGRSRGGGKGRGPRIEPGPEPVPLSAEPEPVPVSEPAPEPTPTAAAGDGRAPTVPASAPEPEPLTAADSSNGRTAAGDDEVPAAPPVRKRGRRAVSRPAGPPAPADESDDLAHDTS